MFSCLLSCLVVCCHVWFVVMFSCLLSCLVVCCHVWLFVVMFGCLLSCLVTCCHVWLTKIFAVFACKIARNQGLMPRRKKDQRNPRVHHRKKFHKALIKYKSTVSIHLLCCV